MPKKIKFIVLAATCRSRSQDEIEGEYKSQLGSRKRQCNARLKENVMGGSIVIYLSANLKYKENKK